MGNIVVIFQAVGIECTFCKKMVSIHYEHYWCDIKYSAPENTFSQESHLKSINWVSCHLRLKVNEKRDKCNSCNKIFPSELVMNGLLLTFICNSHDPDLIYSYFVKYIVLVNLHFRKNFPKNSPLHYVTIPTFFFKFLHPVKIPSAKNTILQSLHWNVTHFFYKRSSIENCKQLMCPN